MCVMLLYMQRREGKTVTAGGELEDRVPCPAPELFCVFKTYQNKSHVPSLRKRPVRTSDIERRPWLK